jgi:hypothetical protein
MATTTIKIAYEVPEADVLTIKELLQQTALFNPNWNNTEFVIERDDFTCMEDESMEAAVLMSEINAIISGPVGKDSGYSP